MLELIRALCTEVGASLLLVSHDPQISGQLPRVVSLSELNRSIASVTAMNLFQLVLKQMRQRALGTWLTLLSVVLGVALAVAVLLVRAGRASRCSGRRTTATT